uniref:Uncharacterized protein n=1 Tax=Timema poppense TaxID=170557 RepID=A0A7R9GYE0_TIMPO|nr:unnamed protein product [Timema poppensis]
MKEGLRRLEGSAFPPPARTQPLTNIPPLRIGAFLPRDSPFRVAKNGSVWKRKLTETPNEVPCTSFDTDWTNNTTPQQVKEPVPEHYLKDLEFEENLLICHPLKGRKTGKDVFEAIDHYFV